MKYFIIIFTILLMTSCTKEKMMEIGSEKPNINIYESGWDSTWNYNTQIWMHRFFINIKVNDNIEFDDLGVDCDETNLDRFVNKYHFESEYHYVFGEYDYDNNPILNSYTIHPYLIINGKKIYGDTQIFTKP